jgi:CRP/FNR family transcriptional regulator, anaerobic regulatory protein
MLQAHFFYREKAYINFAAQPGFIKLDPRIVPTRLTCAICPGLELNICQAASQAEWAVASTPPIPIQQSPGFAFARGIVCRAEDLQDAVPIICEGWAATITMLSDGSRQILSILLPGDIVSTALLFEARALYVVEAITDVHYRMFRRSELKALLFKRSDLLEKFSKAWSEEKSRADRLIVDLGRRNADERIARLVLSIVERLAKRSIARGEPIELDFPMRQRHIADATGLTPVHVSKVLSEFRRNGLIRLSEGSLTIFDLAGFQRIANTR